MWLLDCRSEGRNLKVLLRFHASYFQTSSKPPRILSLLSKSAFRARWDILWSFCLDLFGTRRRNNGRRGWRAELSADSSCIHALHWSIKLLCHTLCHVIGQKMSSKYFNSNSINVVQKSSPGTPVSSQTAISYSRLCRHLPVNTRGHAPNNADFKF